MAVPLSTVAIDVVLELNVGSGYSATVTDPRYNTSQIVDAVLSSDGAVVQALIESGDKEAASTFYSTISGIVNGGTITGDSIAIVSIQFVLSGGSAIAPLVRPGILWDLAEIIEEIQNPLSLNFDPHFYLEGRILYHNGAALAVTETATISVNVLVIGFTRSSAPQAPEQYTWLVYVGAMALLVNLEGEDTPAASYWGGLFMQGLQLIKQGKSGELDGLAKVVREQILLKRLAAA
jgi:hypothetical protein